MAAKKKSGWTRYESSVARDLSSGRVFLSGNVAGHATSASGKFFAYSVTLPPADPKPSGQVHKTFVYELSDDARARLVFECDVRTDLLTVSDEGVIAYRTAAGTEVRHPDGTVVALTGHFVPKFDPNGVLLTNASIDGQMVLARVDPRTGEVKQKHPYGAGNLPFFVLTNGVVAGYGGWLAPDGTLTPLDREWTNPLPCGEGLMFARAPDVEGESVWLDRTGQTKRFPDAFCATSGDGRFGISISYPPIAEAHARGLSAYQARIVERVDLQTGERKPLTALGFPEGRIYTWRGDVLTLVSQGAVLRYDIAKDELLTPRPLETRAVRGDASLHEDGVRIGPAFCALQLAQDLATSPGGAHAIATTQRAHVVVDRKGTKLREFERAARVTFCGDSHVVALPAGKLVELATGQETPLALDGAKGAAALPDGFAVFFDKKLERRGLDGAVKSTWTYKAKPPKGFAPEGVTQVFVEGDALLVVSKQALFRCDAEGVTGLLAKTAKVLGSSTPLRLVAVNGDKVALAAFNSNESWNAVLVCTLDDEVLGWTGGLPEAPVGLAWEGGALLVTERSGITRRFAVT